MYTSIVTRITFERSPEEIMSCLSNQDMMDCFRELQNSGEVFTVAVVDTSYMQSNERFVVDFYSPTADALAFVDKFKRKLATIIESDREA